MCDFILMFTALVLLYYNTISLNKCCKFVLLYANLEIIVVHLILEPILDNFHGGLSGPSRPPPLQ